MISQKLKKIFEISILVFIVHGLEEFFTGLYAVHPFYQSFANPKTAFVILVLVVLNIVLVIAYLLVRNGTWTRNLSVLLGALLIYEFVHFYDAIRVGGYYPGLVTAFAFPIIGFLLWKEFFEIIKVEKLLE